MKNDNDEMFERATETPAHLGCPQHMPVKLPGGFDGAEPGEEVVVGSRSRTKELKNSTVGLGLPTTTNLEELKQRGAKLFACNERSRARIVEIAHLANECLLNTNHPNGYEPGQYGRDYMTYGKTIGQIRRTCKESMLEEVTPDYEWLAKIMTRECFDPDRLAKAIEAEASQRPIDYPTFFTPGWLCELAKKLQENGTIPSSGTVPSALSPTGADTKAAKTAEYMRLKYSFCDGIFPIRRANCEKAVTEHCWVGGRRFTMELTQDIHDDGEHVCCAKIRDNGNLIARLVVYRGKSMSEHMAHATFKEYVRNLSGSSKYKGRGGFLKQAVKRAAAKAAKEVKA